MKEKMSRNVKLCQDRHAFPGLWLRSGVLLLYVACLRPYNLASMQYFADRDIFCAGRVTEEDLQRVAAATGGTVQTSVNNVIDEVFSCFFNLFILLFY